METKFTTGTWHANDGQIYPTETGKTLALIPYFDKNNEEQQANAKLIASAPELLQMVRDLKNCIARLSADNVSQIDRDREAQWIGEANELLIKITNQ